MSIRRACLIACMALAFDPMSHAAAETTSQVMPETMDMLRHAIATQTVEGKDKVPNLRRISLANWSPPASRNRTSRSSRSVEIKGTEELFV